MESEVNSEKMVADNEKELILSPEDMLNIIGSQSTLGLECRGQAD